MSYNLIPLSNSTSALLESWIWSAHLLEIPIIKLVCLYHSVMELSLPWNYNNRLLSLQYHWNKKQSCTRYTIDRFSNRKWVSTMDNDGDLWISETSLSQLENFQHSLVLPNIKYNCAVLFCSHLYWLFFMLQNIAFRINKILLDTNTKIWTEITEIIVFRKKLLKFLQSAYTVYPGSVHCKCAIKQI